MVKTLPPAAFAKLKGTSRQAVSYRMKTKKLQTAIRLREIEEIVVSDEEYEQYRKMAEEEK